LVILVLREAFGEQSVIDGGSVLTVALCQGQRAGKLALVPRFWG
jgi:hypothetical protein